MSTVKIVGKSGQISLGKSLAGKEFVLETLPDGDIILKRVAVIPANQKWLHSPEMQRKLAAADAWMSENKPKSSDLGELESRLGIKG